MGKKISFFFKAGVLFTFAIGPWRLLYGKDFEVKPRNLVIFTKDDMAQAAGLARIQLKHEGKVLKSSTIETRQRDILGAAARKFVEMQCLSIHCGSQPCTGAVPGEFKIDLRKINSGASYQQRFDYGKSEDGRLLAVALPPRKLSVGVNEEGWFLEHYTCTDDPKKDLECAVDLEKKLVEAVQMKDPSNNYCKTVAESGEGQNFSSTLASLGESACDLSPSLCILLASTGKVVAMHAPAIARAGLTTGATLAASGVGVGPGALVGGISGGVLILEETGIPSAIADKLEKVITRNRAKLFPALAVGKASEINQQEVLLLDLQKKFKELYPKPPAKQMGYEGNRKLIETKLQETQHLIQDARAKVERGESQSEFQGVEPRDTIGEYLEALQSILNLPTEVRQLNSGAEKHLEDLLAAHGYFGTDLQDPVEVAKGEKLIRDTVDILRDLHKIGDGQKSTKPPVVLIVGSPGTGKTSLIEEGFFEGTGLETKKFSLAASSKKDFIEDFEKFLQNRKTKNPIIFIDEAGDILSALSQEGGEASGLVSYFKGILGAEDPYVMSGTLGKKLAPPIVMGMGFGGFPDVKLSLEGVTIVFGSNHPLQDSALKNKITKTIVMPKVSLDGRKKRATKVILEKFREAGLETLSKRDQDFIAKSAVKSYGIDDGVRSIEHVAATYANDQIASQSKRSVGNGILSRLQNKKSQATSDRNGSKEETKNPDLIDTVYLNKLFEDEIQKLEESDREKQVGENSNPHGGMRGPHSMPPPHVRPPRQTKSPALDSSDTESLSDVSTSDFGSEPSSPVKAPVKIPIKSSNKIQNQGKGKVDRPRAAPMDDVVY